MSDLVKDAEAYYNFLIEIGGPEPADLVRKLLDQIEAKDKEIERQKGIVLRQHQRNYTEKNKLKAKNKLMADVVEAAEVIDKNDWTRIFEDTARYKLHVALEALNKGK